MNRNEIEKTAQKLLIECNQNEPPINVFNIAECIGINVIDKDFGDQVSGVIVIKDGKAKIGFNSNHVEERIRFTIAHEIGHFILHRSQMDFFIDNTYYALRDDNSSKGEFKMEREANGFAAALLMPKKLIIEEIKKINFDIADENSLNILSKKFKVSTQAMSFRLANLRIF